jgi:ATP-dependent Lhr-like helicase
VEHCRSHANLVFANAKGDIEIYADLANELCRAEGLPEAFIVHHGSLAKEVREDTEQTMKSGRRMTTICSSTLEMGVDIGSVRMVGQIGAPWSVASLRQRMGRSGRREDEPRRLRVYIDCTSDRTGSDPLADLPLDLLQATAVCELMLKRWLEPPRPAKLDLSTLLHQVISTIAETGAIRADSLYERLCVSGPFRCVSQTLFARFLRQVAAKDVVEQSPGGPLILGLEGERIRARRDFYAAFASRTEFTLLAGDRPLGTLPMETAPKVGDHLVFAARRWQVLEVDFVKLVILVSPAKRRKRPSFLGSAGEIHSVVREEMRVLLQRDHDPIYLDSGAKGALAECRAIERKHDLATRRLMPLSGQSCLWMTWSGTAAQRTLMSLLALLGIDATDRKIAIHCRASRDDLRKLLAPQSLAQLQLAELTGHVPLKQYRKFDYLLGDDLLDECIAADRLDFDVAAAVIRETNN